MRFMKALVGVAVLSGTTLVTTGAFSQSTDRLSQNTEPVSATFESTETPVAHLKVGTVVRGKDIPAATILGKSDNSFSFRIESRDGHPPIIVVVNGTPTSQEFTVEDGWKAINAALKRAGFGGEVDPSTQQGCGDINITVSGSGNPTTVVTLNCGGTGGGPHHR